MLGFMALAYHTLIDYMATPQRPLDRESGSALPKVNTALHSSKWGLVNLHVSNTLVSILMITASSLAAVVLLLLDPVILPGGSMLSLTRDWSTSLISCIPFRVADAFFV